MLKLNLYTTSHCHLCEQAEAMLTSIANDYDISWSSIEISDNEQLMETYGTKIPVIQIVDTGVEVTWPFDKEALLRLTNR
ncbi:MAG: glutaredoxin family protein [Methylotenera sp.]|jgi:glutaredoxin|uniref:glutaredoxin family protein n=1 Tax=Methylotenera sp. TaxID=2051956 RepID=UPI0027271F69|nr:glutaredoxin family protein [Methylotenera sp.]MDO9150536.1 glutaredoxin family protein [Methylotenera sp.]